MNKDHISHKLEIVMGVNEMILFTKTNTIITTEVESLLRSVCIALGKDIPECLVLK